MPGGDVGGGGGGLSYPPSNRPHNCPTRSPPCDTSWAC